MLRKLRNQIAKIRSSHILAFLFLIYIFYLGTAPLPQLLTHTADALLYKYSPVQSISKLYETMLETGSAQPLLKNKGTYINFNGLMANILDQPMMNERVTLRNGHLSSVVNWNPSQQDIENAADSLIRFRDSQAAAGGNFLFVLAPSQISKYEDLLPQGYTDNTNETADQFLSLLKASDVPFLDLREQMHRAGISVTEAFYNTDHHWLPETGFWAYTQILEKLHQMGAISAEYSFYTDQENFTFTHLPGTFLGSSGKRTGSYYAGTDDSIFIAPNFDTDISLTIPQRELALQGKYEDVCYNTDAVHNYGEPDYFNENSYGLFGWGDNPLAQWRNDSAVEQGRFLLIGDSFGNVPFSLLPLVLSSCDELDMRYYTEDFTAYYNDYRPDTVIVLVTVDMIFSNNITHPFIPQ